MDTLFNTHFIKKIMLIYKQKDLLRAFEEGEINIIAHQTNCTVGMGAGIAKKIADKYPELNKLDREHRFHYLSKLERPDLLIGKYYIWEKDDKYIVNMYSQYYSGSPRENTTHFDTFIQRGAWLKQCLSDLKSYSDYLISVDNKEIKIGLPLIASGLAANRQLKGFMGDLEYFKKYIAPIVEEELKDLQVTIYYL